MSKPGLVGFKQKEGTSVKSMWEHADRGIKTDLASLHQQQLERLHLNLLQETHPFRDYIFTEAEWSHHHSWKRYLPEPYVLFRLIKRLGPPLLWIVVISVACGIYQEYRPEDGPDLDTLDIAFLFTLLSYALSLLLVFKTNASYGRWWEARIVWGTTVAIIRSLVAKTQAFGDTMTQRQRRMFTRWAIALPWVMRSHLLSYVPGSLVLEPLLTRAEYEWLLTKQNMPLAVTQMIGTLLNSVEGLDPFLLAQLHLELTNYVSMVTACERISRTPIPMAYTRHTVRFVTCYTSVLPLALWAHIKWVTVLAAPVAAFLLFAIENIGNQIENPMLVLPLAGYCKIMHIDIVRMTDAWVAMGDKDPTHVMRKLLDGDVPDWQDTDTDCPPPQKEASDGELQSGRSSTLAAPPPMTHRLTSLEIPDICMGNVGDAGDDETASSVRLNYPATRVSNSSWENERSTHRVMSEPPLPRVDLPPPPSDEVLISLTKRRSAVP